MLGLRETIALTTSIVGEEAVKGGWRKKKTLGGGRGKGVSRIVVIYLKRERTWLVNGRRPHGYLASACAAAAVLA